ncbi:diphosphomevalonate decarboxylase [Flavobacteriaceae bacterium]|nr:diphosphomevalonate decarboxylase [Flavobacteriaceae bacterium]
MILDKFIANYSNRNLENKLFSCQSPSNIALVKYWGKSDPQIPKNASVSFTLNNCHTSMSIEVQEKTNKDSFSFDVWFEGALKAGFRPKIETFFERITTYIPFLKDFHFVLRSENSFPHSSGIASSASSMSAIAYCLMQIERELNPGMTDLFFNEKTSFLARLGSGSACRSVEGPLVVWGEVDCIPESSDLYGVKFPFEVHAVFEDFQDTILLIDKGEKQVSSTLGHNLMNGHPFAEQRFLQANQNLDKLSNILQSGDLEGFMALVESEALTLHAMMMTSDPYFILMRPGTLQVIEKIWRYRKETGNALCFTLDAGANVHLLYPASQKDEVLAFIEAELVVFCQNNQYIRDYTGIGIKTL